MYFQLFKLIFFLFGVLPPSLVFLFPSISLIGYNLIHGIQSLTKIIQNHISTQIQLVFLLTIASEYFCFL